MSRLKINHESVRLDEFLPKTKRSKRKTIGPAEFAKVVAETKRMGEVGDFAGMKPKHLLALYYVMHGVVYKVSPDEVLKQYQNALLTIGRFVKAEFDGDVARVVEFIRWTWKREKKREARRKDDPDPFRIGWKYQFGYSLLTDYRRHLSKFGRIDGRSKNKAE